MVYFAIFGKKDCQDFTRAIFVADYLKKHLPNFKYYSDNKEEIEWKNFLIKINSQHKWFCIKSPVIWKEVAWSGTEKPLLIGGLSEFWEYCSDYYGFQVYIPKKDLELLHVDYKTSSKQPITVRTITIYGGLHKPRLISLLLSSFKDLSQHIKNEQCVIKLYDEDFEESSTSQDLLHIAQDIENCWEGLLPKVQITVNGEEALRDCQLLIIIKEYPRNKLNTSAWLRRCALLMRILAGDINDFCNRDVKIIVCTEGCSCFNASILVENCSLIRLANIVAVTATEGLSLLTAASQQTSILVENMAGPPVWGAPGLESFVDLDNTICLCDVYKPFKRALKSTEKSILPKGFVTKEIRLLQNQLDDKEAVLNEAKRRKNKIGGTSVYNNVRAIISLLNLWWGSTTTYDGEIISLGICSNGTFGIPPGMVFSQPAILNEKGFWEPCREYPVKPELQLKIEKMVAIVKENLTHCDIDIPNLF